MTIPSDLSPSKSAARTPATGSRPPWGRRWAHAAVPVLGVLHAVAGVAGLGLAVFLAVLAALPGAWAELLLILSGAALLPSVPALVGGWVVLRTPRHRRAARVTMLLGATEIAVGLLAIPFASWGPVTPLVTVVGVVGLVCGAAAARSAAGSAASRLLE